MDEGEEKEREENYKKPVEDNNEKPAESSDEKPVEEHSKVLKEEPKRLIKSDENLTNKLRGNPFIISTIVCGILAVLLLIAVTSGGITGNVVSKEVAGENVLAFASSQVTDMEILSVEKEDGFYKVEFTSEETGKSSLYITLDGKNLISGLIPLDIPETANTPSTTTDIPKSDKPKVELFVMTHCPYGTQAEKGLIPVIEMLGDTIDAKINFIHYFMHDPEEAETPRQVCIREEQEEKWPGYLECFLEDGNADRCLTEVGIDKVGLSDCISTQAEGYYAEDSDLSEGYGVQGSPTLVINGKIVSSARSPAAYLDTICQAFNDAPAECEETLSSTTPSSMWGWDASGASTAAQC